MLESGKCVCRCGKFLRHFPLWPRGNLPCSKGKGAARALGNGIARKYLCLVTIITNV